MNDATSQIHLIFDALNEKLFDGQIQRVPITFQLKKKVSLRWFAETASLVIGSDFPNLEITDLLVVMLHEMIHIHHFQIGVQDCTTNQYHNKYFLEAALKVGLVAIKHKTQGWSITTTVYPRNVVEKEYIARPSKEAVAKRITVFSEIKYDKGILKQARLEMRNKIKSGKPPKTYFLKYICNCPPPHNSIRSGRRPDGPHALNILCQNCHSTMVCVNVPEEP